MHKALESQGGSHGMWVGCKRSNLQRMGAIEAMTRLRIDPAWGLAIGIALAALIVLIGNNGWL